MSLQTIWNFSSEIQVNRRRMIGSQTTRNGLLRLGETPTVIPWQFSVKYETAILFNRARTLIETLDNMDRNVSETITLGSGTNMSWLYKYQGQQTQLNLDRLKVISFVGNQLVLDTSTLTSATNSVIFEKGDIFNIVGYPHPFTSTTQIINNGTTVTVTTHRPNIIQTNIASNSGLLVGANTQIKVICKNMPTYTLKPGGYQYVNNVLVNAAYIEFDSDFDLYEFIS
jgi:hypothetical protein